MAEGVSCSLDVLYGGQFLIKTRKEKNLSCFFVQFLFIKTLDPYTELNPESLEMLDRDPDSMNPGSTTQLKS